MNDAVAQTIASNQSLTLVAVGVLATLWIASKVYDVVSTKKNGKSQDSTGILPAEVIKDVSVTMSMLAKTVERMESDMSIVRENLTSVKEAVSRIESQQRDRHAGRNSGPV